jgi:hypothetical protein
VCGPSLVGLLADTGRPRLYCSPRCGERSKRLAELGRRADVWEAKGFDDVAERIRNRIAVNVRLWRAA